ncbi:MAG: hypothetical protein FWJ93_01665 [Micromonosporaceae bacterium]
MTSVPVVAMPMPVVSMAMPVVSAVAVVRLTHGFIVRPDPVQVGPLPG